MMESRYERVAGVSNPPSLLMIAWTSSVHAYEICVIMVFMVILMIKDTCI